MKWLCKFFLFICILSTAGSGHYSPAYALSKANIITIAKQHFSDHAKFTPVIPEKDGRVFQLIEDEEDNVTSRVKKAPLHCSLLLAMFYAGALVFLYQSNIKHQSDN